MSIKPSSKLGSGLLVTANTTGNDPTRKVSKQHEMEHDALMS